MQLLQFSASECSLSNLNYLRFKLFCFVLSSLIILPPSRACLRPLLRYWLLRCCFPRCCLSLRFIGLSLLVLASSSYYLYIWSFMWLTIKIGTSFFRGQMHAHSFPIFLLLPSTASFPTQPQHSHMKVLQDLQYIIERNWSVKKNTWRLAYSEDTPVKRAGIGIIISASSRFLPYSITHTAKYILCNIRSLNTHMPFVVSTKPELSFGRSSTFVLCGASRIV